ncbi:MAG TPA: YceI family protein [Candidatus Paceibacterota bacterium]
MKTKIILLIVAVIVVGGVLLALRRDKPSMGVETVSPEDMTTSTSTQPASIEDGNYKITDDQTIGWNAKKRVGGGHNGTIDVTKGEFTVKDNSITKGSIDFSLASLVDLDLEDGKAKTQLESDLKGEGFFNTEKYPNGSFSVTKASPIVAGSATLTGNLTLKGKTSEVSFPVMVQADKDMITLTGTMTFNRTKFGINYASASIPGAVKDVIIEDEVGVTIASTFKKK